MIGHKKAPAIPDSVAVMDSRATDVVLIFNSVRANRIAVPDTVATASDIKNHAIKNTITSRSFTATLIVFHNDFHANFIKYSQARHRLWAPVTSNGGPGRVRSHRRLTMVNEPHHTPTRSSTSRVGRVPDVLGIEVLFKVTKSKMLRICTNTAAQ